MICVLWTNIYEFYNGVASGFYGGSEAEPALPGLRAEDSENNKKV